MLDPRKIETRYARSGGLSIAYQVVGDGPVDLVFIPGWVSNVEAMWDLPEYAGFITKLTDFARVILLDRRGTGLSDPVPEAPTLEERMDDVRAVMDAERWERATIWGVSEGGPMALVFAATYPERSERLVLYGTFPRLAQAPDYPHGVPHGATETWLRSFDDRWGRGELSKLFAPNRVGDPSFTPMMARMERQAMSPGTAKQLFTLLFDTDVRAMLSAVRTPTLVIHRKGDRAVRIDHARFTAERISGAKLVELDGEDHIPFFGDPDDLIAEVREFLTGERLAPEPDRVLATILFCDIVDSTARAAELGDREWRSTLERFYAMAADQLRRDRGRLLDTAGDGLFASFDGPARAVRSSLALRDAVRRLGLEMRTGIHTGECEILGDKYSGIAVHIGARVAGCAGAGEVVVTSTVRDLAAGSGIRFEDLGLHALKGVPRDWQLFRVASPQLSPAHSIASR